MAGLVGAVRAAGPSTIVERAARPLLRRPWHTFRSISDEMGEATLGFAGERGGVVCDPITGVIAAVDGEVVDVSTVTGDEAAWILLRRYLEHGFELDPPDGWFAAAIWDPRDRAVILVSDQMGHRPIYVAQRGGSVLFAGELKALLAAGVEPRLDLQTWAELLAFEFPLGDHTAIDGVRGLLPAVTMRIGPEGVAVVRERWRYRLEPADKGDEDELTEEFGRLLEQAVSRRFDDGTALALSGGIDSRCLAAILGRRWPGSVALTYGATSSEDLEIGTHIAARAGLSGRRLPLEPGYLVKGAAETVWLTEGQIRCLHAHHLALHGVRDGDDVTSLLIGLAGDAVLRNYRGIPPARVPSADGLYTALAGCVDDALAEQVLGHSFAGALRGRAREEFGRLLEDEEGSPASRVRQFVWRNSHRRKVFPGSELFFDELAPRDPYDDVDLFEFCRRLPEAFRIGGKLQRSFLREFPSLAVLLNPKDGLAPALEGRRRRLAAYRVRLVARAGRELERRSRRAFIGGSRGLGDYASEIRGASAHVFDVLLEPRTIERGQLRREGVRRLIDETRSGKARHTRSLGMLLTFELFQRQFVDGETPPLPATLEVARSGA